MQPLVRFDGVYKDSKITRKMILCYFVETHDKASVVTVFTVSASTGEQQ